MKLFNDRAMGFFSIGALFGLLLCMRSEGLHVLNIVMWVVAGLFLLLFFYCRENMTAAVVALILFVLSLLGTILLAIKDSSESRNQPEK